MNEMNPGGVAPKFELKTVEYRCNDGCGTSLIVPVDQEPLGWMYLHITKRWRCPACRRELDLVNGKGDA